MFKQRNKFLFGNFHVKLSVWRPGMSACAQEEKVFKKDILFVFLPSTVPTIGPITKSDCPT